MISGNQTLDQLYRQGRMALAEAPNAQGNSGFEAFFLFEKVFGLSREELILRGQQTADKELADRYGQLIDRRIQGEPLQYLLGEWEFYGIPFAVGPGVLIPRPETELLVELALDHLSSLPEPRVLDLCSGTGCIPITIALTRPDSRCMGVELSPAAFAFFQTNIRINSTGNVTPLLGDIFALPEAARSAAPFDLITANPPYIASAQLAGLQQEVRREPVLALDGGADGLDFYRRLPSLAVPLLRRGGMLALEIGEDQGEAVAHLVASEGFGQVQVHRDLSGLDRIVTAIYHR